MPITPNLANIASESRDMATFDAMVKTIDESLRSYRYRPGRTVGVSVPTESRPLSKTVLEKLRKSFPDWELWSRWPDYDYLWVQEARPPSRGRLRKFLWYALLLGSAVSGWVRFFWDQVPWGEL